jgi:maltose alpha-D-glucosyltransferase/alpha-amylase
MVQGLVMNEGDGWQWTLEELERYYESSAPMWPPADMLSLGSMNYAEMMAKGPSDLAREHAGIYLDAAGVLGRRTAELHLALATPTENPAFAPEPMTARQLADMREGFLTRGANAFEVLKENLSRLPDDVVELAGLVLGRRRVLLDQFRPMGTEVQALRSRIHGDYHLGQVLRVRSDFVILDFEGEPARPLEERRSKQSPLKDVAGMLRSFGYAAYSALMRYTSRRPEDLQKLEPWARLWEQAACAEFLRVYRETAGKSPILPSDPDGTQGLLSAFILDKALYELVYELNNRPAWVRIPLTGILSLQV